MTTKDLILELSDAVAADADRIGAKAAGQAMMASAGLPTAGGFCLDAGAYRLQLEALGLAALADEAARLARREARRAIAEVRLGLFEGAITPAVLDPLLAAWRRLMEGTGKLGVVRSSALMEDRAGSNFAGQFESFLGIEGETDFLTCVRACWAAPWSSRVLQYMESHQIGAEDRAMAVIVQPLIEARVSGGGMSRTADGGMMLTATWGLGSAIAQGEVVPDRYELSAKGDLREVAAGNKRHSVHCVHHGGTPAARAVSGQRARQRCLTDKEAVSLARLLRRVEGLMGGPVEIEWAQDQLGFKILQARPLLIQPAQVPDEIWLRHPGLRGHPSGVGWGAGRACVISCECELSRVAPGDVLVTKVAGPALSHVLPKVSGVVAELGGSTSHLASLARERGIPMVLGLTDATARIPDGAQVGIDGVTGIVRWMN